MGCVHTARRVLSVCLLYCIMGEQLDLIGPWEIRVECEGSSES